MPNAWKLMKCLQFVAPNLWSLSSSSGHPVEDFFVHSNLCELKFTNILWEWPDFYITIKILKPFKFTLDIILISSLTSSALERQVNDHFLLLPAVSYSFPRFLSSCQSIIFCCVFFCRISTLDQCVWHMHLFINEGLCITVKFLCKK